MPKTAILAAAAALAAAAPAGAVVYEFDYSVDGSSASLLINLPNPSQDDTADGVTGTRDGIAIAGLSDYAGADNTFDPVEPYFSQAGFSYDVGTTSYNIFVGPDNATVFETNSVRNPDGIVDTSTNDTTLETSSVINVSYVGAPRTTPPPTGNPSAVPEAATWAMMVGGFGMAGIGMRRRRPALRHA